MNKKTRIRTRKRRTRRGKRRRNTKDENKEISTLMMIITEKDKR